MKKEFLDAKVFAIKKHPLVLDDYGEHLNIMEFDFKKPSKFSKEQIRIFDMIHGTFAGFFESRISMITRDIFEVTHIMTEQKIYSEYTASVKDQSMLAVVKLSSFDADIVFQLGNNTLFLLIDKILGGDGQAEINRELTEIELNLAREIINIFMETLSEAWSTAEQMQFTVKAIENSAQFVRIAPPNEMCLVFNFKIELASKIGFFTLCLPFISIKPVLDDLNRRSLYEGNTAFFSNNKNKKMGDSINRISLDASVVLGTLDLTFSEIDNLEAGDILKLKTHTSDSLEMVVSDSRLFRVKPGKISNKLAVKIVEKFEMEA